MQVSNNLKLDNNEIMSDGVVMQASNASNSLATIVHWWKFSTECRYRIGTEHVQNRYRIINQVQNVYRTGTE
jgi:hypothetical protein